MPEASVSLRLDAGATEQGDLIQDAHATVNERRRQQLFDALGIYGLTVHGDEVAEL